MILPILLSVSLGFLFAEVVGYVVHILLHSERLPWLSRGHMLHHLRDYGPKTTLRSETYFASSSTRWNLFGFGIEWILPLGLTIFATIGLMNLFAIAWFLQLPFLASALFWGYLMFSYMHASMHLRNFWMLKYPGFKQWYLRARRLHDIHHLRISDDGRMLTNFGICFFFMDALFRTKQTEALSFNHKGLDAAMKRYDFIWQQQ